MYIYTYGCVYIYIYIYILVGTLIAPNFRDTPSKNLLEVFACSCTFSAKFAISIHVV